MSHHDGFGTSEAVCQTVRYLFLVKILLVYCLSEGILLCFLVKVLFALPFILPSYDCDTNL